MLRGLPYILCLSEAQGVNQMPYSAKADILEEVSEQKLIELTDDEDAGVVNDDRVAAAIAKADGIIDSYCGQVTAVPFTDVPPIIKQHSITIAIYYLFSRREAVPEVRESNYKDAISHLKDIAACKAALPPIADEDVADEPQSSKTDCDRVFSMGKRSDGSHGNLDRY